MKCIPKYEIRWFHEVIQPVSDLRGHLRSMAWLSIYCPMVFHDGTVNAM